VSPARAEPGGVAAVVLGAGRGSRFGGEAPKQLARLGLRSLVGHALAAAVGSGLEPVLLVVGYRGHEVASVAGPKVAVVDNPDWEEGISSSLRCALVDLLSDPAVSAAERRPTAGWRPSTGRERVWRWPPTTGPGGIPCSSAGPTGRRRCG
jgi:hypothetical protein